jgi:hypothetical protein
MTTETIVLWEAPALEKPEFRLYYDEEGNVITYTTEKLPGNFIVIDKMTFAEARPDVKVFEGSLTRKSNLTVVSKLIPNIEGISCSIDDISILYNGSETINWSLKTREYRIDS